MAAAKIGRGVVARGHTVMVDGAPVTAGEPVSLPSDEIESLVKAGFLVDAKAPEIERSNGPKLVSDGPSVKQVA